MSLLFATFSNSFSNVGYQDLVVRTAENTQKLILGTGWGSMCNACMYINDNRLGINKIPGAGTVFDCANAMNIDDTDNVNITQNLNSVFVNACNLNVDLNGVLNSSNSILSNLITTSINSLTTDINIGNYQTCNINIGQYGSQAINIGSFNGTVNLGNYNDIVNVSGTSFNINSSNVLFANQTISLNSLGGAGTGGSTGFQIIEGGITTGYIQTSSDRNSFMFQTPNGTGQLGLNLQNNMVAFNNALFINNGSVGINTSIPTSQFTVNGDIRTNTTLLSPNLTVSQNGFIQNLSSSNFSIGNAIVSNLTTSVIQASNIVMTNQDLNGKIVLYPNQNNNDYQVAAIGYSNSALIFQTDNQSVPFVFSQGVNSTSSAEVLRITNTGIGINTQVPTQPIDVAGNVSVRSNLYVGFIQANMSDLTIEPTGSSDSVHISSTNSNGQVSLLGSHIFTANQVGINKTPNCALDVNGTGTFGNIRVSGLDGILNIASLSQSSGFGDATLIAEHIRYISSTGNFSVISDGTNASGSGIIADQGNLHFYAASFPGHTADYGITNANMSFLERLTVTSSGVGVGTSNPLYPFQVYGTGKDIFVCASGTANFSQGLNIQDTSTTWLLYKPSSTSDLRINNGSTDNVTFQNSGNVGIGTTNPIADLHIYDNGSGHDALRVETPNGSIRFTANGQLRAYSSSGFNYFLASTNVSDEKLKEEVKPISDPLSIISKLDGIYFKYKKELQIGDQQRVGFIAQDVLKHHPEIVDTDDESDILRIDYEKITPLLLEGIKELHEIVKSQNLEIQALKQMLS